MADVTSVITPGELRYIREAFARQPDSLTNMARMQVVSAYPDGAGVVTPLPDHFFVPGKEGGLPMSASERERCIIAILASTETDSGMLLAVHFYWGLAVGLDPKDIAETLMLAATYSGLPHWTVSIGRFAALLHHLKDAVEEARVLCSKMLGGTTTGPQFEEEMLKALSPPAVAQAIRRHMTFASVAAVESIKSRERS